MENSDNNTRRSRLRLALAGAGMAFVGGTLLLSMTLGGGGTAVAQEDGTATATESATVTETATATETTTATETATATETGTATGTATATETGTATETATVTETPSPSPTVEPETETYELDFRWSLLGWLGPDGADILAALQGNLSPDGDLSDDVTAIFSWDSENQDWLGYFPGSEDVPGANDFSTFSFGQAFWIAIDDPNGLTWTVTKAQ
ncbi:MAG: hypothetical protein ACM3S1_03035 [Hyphomicrobiales bacterium]